MLGAWPGDRPLHFEASSSVPEAWRDLDVAFSHEVLYLLPDLAPHAAAIHGSLRPGGVYFAVMGMHTGSPMMVEWHAANREELQLPPLYDIDDVIATFRHAGFDASVARLSIRFVPVAGQGHHHEGRPLDWLSLLPRPQAAPALRPVAPTARRPRHVVPGAEVRGRGQGFDGPRSGCRGSPNDSRPTRGMRRGRGAGRSGRARGGAERVHR